MERSKAYSLEQTPQQSNASNPVSLLSTGTFQEALNYQKYLKKLVRAERVVARRIPGGSNWQRAKARVTRLRTKIANIRADFHYKQFTVTKKDQATNL